MRFAYALPLLLAACAGRTVETLPDTSEPLPEGPSARAEADDLAVTLTVDEAVYTAKANTIRCVTTPCPSNAEPAVVHALIVIENLSDEVRLLEFTSGQRFSLQLLDADGEVVRDWAADKSFLQAVETLELQPGEAERWQAELLAEDAGAYTLRADVMGHGPEARLPLEVVLEGQ